MRSGVIALALVAGSTLVVIGSAQEHRALLSSDLLAFEARQTTARSRVIVPGTAAQISDIAERHDLQILRSLGPSGAVLAANSFELTALAADPAIPSLTGDVLIQTDMSIAYKSTAADQVRAGTSGLLGIGSVPGVNGSGIRVAVLDSGISPHPALAGRIAHNISFVTGDSSTGDAYGHGTHVAGIITGASSSVTSLYKGGIAPGAQVINVRVLGANGSGLTSDVIAGLEWVIANRNTYNIRVANLSLGHPVTQPSIADPLCQAIARAVASGIVVVVSAGNNGQDANGNKILGGISSPGNSPYALTVGSLNTWNTITRADDTVSTYSSRGPTKYEMAVKPDLAAPGNKIVSLEAQGSRLATNYTYLHRAGSASNGYMQLSGTSMSAPMVSGAVALLLQGSPWMKPAQIKLVLQSGATYVSEGGLMGAGAGSGNFWSSRRIAHGGLLQSLPTAVIGGLLTVPSGASFWDAGTLADRLYSGSGLRLLGLLDLSALLGNPSLINFGELNLVGGLLNPLKNILPKRLLYGQIADWTSADAILWGTQIYDPSGNAILWGTSDEGDAILWGTSDDGDAILWGTSDDGDAILWGTTDIETQPDPQ